MGERCRGNEQIIPAGRTLVPHRGSTGSAEAGCSAASARHACRRASRPRRQTLPKCIDGIAWAHAPMSVHLRSPRPRIGSDIGFYLRGTGCHGHLPPRPKLGQLHTSRYDCNGRSVLRTSHRAAHPLQIGSIVCRPEMRGGPANGASSLEPSLQPRLPSCPIVEVRPTSSPTGDDPSGR